MYTCVYVYFYAHLYPSSLHVQDHADRRVQVKMIGECSMTSVLFVTLLLKEVCVRVCMYQYTCYISTQTCVCV